MTRFLFGSILLCKLGFSFALFQQTSQTDSTGVCLHTSVHLLLGIDNCDQRDNEVDKDKINKKEYTNLTRFLFELILINTLELYIDSTLHLES